jgi:lipid-binding SYLF domain-containing protein
MRILSLARFALAASLVAGGAGMVGCSTAPPSDNQQQTLRGRVDVVLDEMKRSDPGLQDTLSRSYGYAVFPDAGKAGVIVGASFGRGEVFEQGKFVGWAKLEQATVGAQVGGATYDELIIFQDQASLRKFQRGEWAPAANASAVILKTGAAASAPYKDGVLVLINTKGGAMVEAAVGGQKFTYRAGENRDQTWSD